MCMQMYRGRDLGAVATKDRAGAAPKRRLAGGIRGKNATSMREVPRSLGRAKSIRRRDQRRTHAGSPPATSCTARCAYGKILFANNLHATIRAMHRVWAPTIARHPAAADQREPPDATVHRTSSD